MPNGFLRHSVLPPSAHRNQALMEFLLRASRDPSLLRDYRNHTNEASYARTQGFDLSGINPVYPRGRR